MSKGDGPDHVVVDGSNIATEGRSMPSLAQLQEAVMSFMEENPDAAVTVVVDATFGHRIPKSEAADYEAGIANNELVAPPAGAIGRGDAFVLGIADKANATVLSNDSFQEFHGEYEWLFDEGRLIGGKPVPHVGWVWVPRMPVRGPVSRKATRGSSSKRGSSTSRVSRKKAAARESSSSGRRGRRSATTATTSPTTAAEATAGTAPDDTAPTETAGSDAARSAAVPKGSEPVNELMPFLDFVESSPVGTEVTGIVDVYSSHGAYVLVDAVLCYIPLKSMGDPPPNRARDLLTKGETQRFVVDSVDAPNRGVDLALPGFRQSDDGPDDLDLDEPDDGDVVDSSSSTPDTGSTATMAAKKKASAKKAATKKKAAARKKAAAKKTAAKKKSATKKAAAKKTAASSVASSNGADDAPATDDIGITDLAAD